MAMFKSADRKEWSGRVVEQTHVYMSDFKLLIYTFHQKSNKKKGNNMPIIFHMPHFTKKNKNIHIP